MLSDLEKKESVIHIAGREYRIRYSLNCLLCLEKIYIPIEKILETDFYKWDIDTIIHLVHAAMCDMPWNRKAVNRRDFDRINPTLQQLGEKINAADLPALRAELADALINSLPDKDEYENKSASSADEGHLKAFAVDVIGIPEKEFWNSNYRELDYRLNKYLEVKGMKEMPVEIQMFDKED